MPKLIDICEVSEADKKAIDLTKVGVVIPAYNEPGIMKTIETVHRAGIPWQNIYVGDDGSTDATANYIYNYEDKKGIRAFYQNNTGKEGMIRTILNGQVIRKKKQIKLINRGAVKNKNLDTLIFFDANQLDIEDGKALAYLIQNGYSYAFAERNKIHMPFLRALANTEAKMLLGMLFLHHEYENIFQDPLCGLYAVSRKAAEKLAPKLNKRGRFLLEPHVKYWAMKEAQKTRESIAVFRGVFCPYGNEIKSAMRFPNVAENSFFGDGMLPAISKLREMNPVLGEIAYNIFYKGGHEVYSYTGFPMLEALNKTYSKTKETAREISAVLKEVNNII